VVATYVRFVLSSETLPFTRGLLVPEAGSEVFVILNVGKHLRSLFPSITTRFSMLVMKFGGSSVANQPQIQKVAAIVRSRVARQPVVVSSAHKGMTDALIQTARQASKGTYDAQAIILKQKTIAQELGCPVDILDDFYSEIEDLLRGINLVKELSTRSLDYISSFGERMSVRCIADYFTRNGIVAQAFDVWDLGFITDSTFGNARPLPGYETVMKQAFARLVPDGVVPVVTGFVGKNEAGEITTVGRNGSDLTATLVAAAIDAQEVEIWTDTDGVMSADPSLVAGAKNIPYMRFDEAAELAYFGSRVLHPSTLLPAIARKIPVRVLNTNRPEHPGTVIEEQSRPTKHAVTSIAYKENQTTLTINTTRMFGQAGFLAKVFDILGKNGVVVDLIATSEVSVSLTVNNRAQLESCLSEIQPLGQCKVQSGKTILAVVGQHLPERAGIGAEILRAVGETGVNVEMVSFGLGSINFSMLIDDKDIQKVVPTLHRILFENDNLTV
jgi:aspartate kinase